MPPAPCRDDDGTLRMRGAAGEIAPLQAEYVAEHLALAYASTVHAAQGRTVDTSHALFEEAAVREAAYVALSRGRDTNTAYLVALRDSDEHQAERLDATAAGRLARVLGNDEQLALFDPADVEAEPAIEQTVEMDVDREAVDEPERIAEAQLSAEPELGREPEAERVPETSPERTVVERTAEPVVELDDVEPEEQLAAASAEPVAQDARDVDMNGPAVPEPAEEAERAPEVEPDVGQLTLLDVEPCIEDKVGAASLRAEADTAAEQAAAEREQQEERTRATLAEARRAAEAAEQQRLTQEAVAEARAAIEACFLLDWDAAEAERERRDEAERQEQLIRWAERQEQLIRWAERQEQLIRWAEQDRTAERDRGADEGFDDGPSIDY